jgi:hypothetical protein
MIAKKLPGRLQLAPSFDLRLLRGGSRPAIGGKAAQQRRGAADRGKSARIDELTKFISLHLLNDQTAVLPHIVV